MIRSIRTLPLLVLIVVAAAACAVRLGGPSPENYDTVALAAPSGASAADVGAAIRAAGAEIAFIAAPQDAAWLTEVAAAAGLALSGPSTSGEQALAFMTNVELLGDTSLVLAVPAGGTIHMHDALYKVDNNRNLDLMIVHFDAPDLRAAVRTLLGYIATDVGADVALVLAVSGDTPQAADSAAVLMRATLGSGLECVTENQSAPLTGTLPVRLLYGPSARMGCLGARPLEGMTGVNARLQVR